MTSHPAPTSEARHSTTPANDDAGLGAGPTLAGRGGTVGDGAGRGVGRGTGVEVGASVEEGWAR